MTIDDDYLPAPGLGGELGNVQRRQDLDLSPAGKRYLFRWHAAHRQFTRWPPPSTSWTALRTQYADDKGYYRNLTYFISSISASDDYTVVVKSKRSYWGLL